MFKDVMLGLDTVSVIDDKNLLAEIKKHCYCDNDVRAVWAGVGLPQTNDSSMQNFANWATEHWTMYYGFIKDLDTTQNYNIIDVGCACGHSTVCLASVFKNSNIIGIDISENSINFAKKYNQAHNIKYICSDFFQTNNTHFDFVFALEILEHLPSDSHYNFVDKCLSIVNENGKVFLTTPNALDEQDEKSGHIGLLNRQRAKPFIERYKNNIEHSAFYDNKRLLKNQYIIDEDIGTFEAGTNKSHFKLVMRKL